MCWKKIEPYMTDHLEDCIERCYSVFSKYKLNGMFRYCDCNVCMTNETALKLSQTPLREIPAKLLAEYTNSAHGYDKEVIEPEFKYFLPRYLELIAECDPPVYDDIEISLDRLGLANYRSSWPEAEVSAVDDLFYAFVDASLHQMDIYKGYAGWTIQFDMGQVFIIIARAGGDLKQALAVLYQGQDPEAAVHMAHMRKSLKLKNGRMLFDRTFLEDFKQAADMIGSWLIRDSVTTRILAAPELLDNPDYDDMIEMALINL